MNHDSVSSLQNFKNLVALKYQLYNSLFTSLPFYGIEKTGMLLSLFINFCEEGFEKKMSPEEIIEDFFSKQDRFNSRRRCICTGDRYGRKGYSETVGDAGV